jgi:hypothetical protein
MPTVLRVGSYRLFFYSADAQEPPHIHVERDGMVAKFWIDPVRLVRSGGFRRSELRTIERMVTENTLRLMEEWDGFFGG